MVGHTLEYWKKQQEQFNALPQIQNKDWQAREYHQEVIDLVEAILREDKILMAREDVWHDALSCTTVELLRERQELRDEIQELESRYDNLLADIGGVSPG
jgi:hypothetical protein